MAGFSTVNRRARGWFGTALACARRLQGRLPDVVDFDNVIEADDIGPDLHVRVHVTKLDLPLPFLGLLHQLEEGRIAHAAEVGAPAHVEQDRLRDSWLATASAPR